MFRDPVPNVFKLVDDNDDDGMIQNISKAIPRECKHLVHDKNKYTIRVDKQTGINSVSATLISLLENLSDNPWFKLPSIVIGNIITSAVTSALQIGLGVTLGKKSLSNNFMILVSVAYMMNYCDLKHQQQCLHQTKCNWQVSSQNNFDANITAPNGLKSTYALALLMTQVCPNTEEGQKDTSIKRLKKENVKDSSPSGILISYYHGPKKA